MDFLSWRWLNPITLEAINPQQCNFPSRQDLPGFPSRAPCSSLFPLQHTVSPRLSLPHLLYLVLPFSSIIPSFFCLCLSPFFHSTVSCLSRLRLLQSPISLAFYPSLAPSNAPSPSYYTTLPVTFISPSSSSSLSSPPIAMSPRTFLPPLSHHSSLVFFYISHNSPFLLLYPTMHLCLIISHTHISLHFPLSLPPRHTGVFPVVH